MTNPQTSSSTSHLLDELALYGTRAHSDDADYRPLPDEDRIEIGLAAIMEGMVTLFADTRLEDDLETLLWSQVNLFHTRMKSVQKALDENEDKQKLSLAEQDGSEVKSVELERLVREGLTLTEQRNAFEAIRDNAADHFRTNTGSVWMPRTGCKVAHRNLTSAVIDSRNYISAKRRKENEVHCPEGTRIAFTGGDYQDHQAIWFVLDQTLNKYPDMILLHGGTPKGAELIAAKWAENRNITQVVFKPDWASHNKAAPFKRNDRLLEAMPIGLIACPGTGITDNLVDKARKLTIPVKRIGIQV